MPGNRDLLLPSPLWTDASPPSRPGPARRYSTPVVPDPAPAGVSGPTPAREGSHFHELQGYAGLARDGRGTSAATVTEARPLNFGTPLRPDNSRLCVGAGFQFSARFSSILP